MLTPTSMENAEEELRKFGSTKVGMVPFYTDLAGRMCMFRVHGEVRVKRQRTRMIFLATLSRMEIVMTTMTMRGSGRPSKASVVEM